MGTRHLMSLPAMMSLNMATVRQEICHVSVNTGPIYINISVLLYLPSEITGVKL